MIIFSCLCDEIHHRILNNHGRGGCESPVTAITRCWWVKFRDCRELLYGRRFPMKLKTAVYGSYVRPAILYGSEAWCLTESEMGIL